MIISNKIIIINNDNNSNTLFFANTIKTYLFFIGPIEKPVLFHIFHENYFMKCIKKYGVFDRSDEKKRGFL